MLHDLARLCKPLIMILLVAASISTNLMAGPKRVRLYGIRSYSIGGVQTHSPIRFLELFAGGEFRWLREDRVINGSYVLQEGVLELRTVDGILARGSANGDGHSGSVTFFWYNTDEKKTVLRMCIADAINWPPAEEHCG
jgi:hypothetical protein